MTNTNLEIMKEMLESLTTEKKLQLKKTLERNAMLTSTYDLSQATLSVYKEGYYLELEGTRCKFAVYYKDEDGELKIQKRKPIKLSLLYKVYDNVSRIYNYC